MKAGFSRIKLTPAIGTTMTGYIRRDREGGCEGVHDDLYVRALYLDDRDEEAIIMGFDLCFFSRDEVDRFKGAIGRRLDLSPQQILFNTSHTHTGPKVGTWQYDPPSDRLYLQVVEDAIVEAAIRSRESTVEVTLWSGATRSALPMSRRLKLEDGTIVWRPSPDADVCDTLPVCALKDSAGNMVCVLFSVACHPSTVHGREISADYPGVAMDLLDSHLGRTCSLFLQGTGGDAKPSVIGEGETDWRRGTWEDMDRAGNIVAEEVLGVLKQGLSSVEPGLRTRTIEAPWPLEANIGRAGYEAVLVDPESILTRRLWAEEKLAWLDSGHELPTTVPVTTHGIRLGDGLRIVGLEGEAVAAFGLQIQDHYDGGITFPLGYTDGVQMYLVTSKMLDEGGYEAISSHEYHQPAPLAKGMETVLDDSLKWLVEQGID